jgi:putative endonuclease
MLKNKQKAYNFGIWGEYCAMLFYICKCYTILKHRYKTVVGEIDFICKRFNTLVFVEVKSRQTNTSCDDLCLTTQQRRIAKTAQLFLLKNGHYQKYDIRFDLILIRPFRLPKIFSNFIVG